MVSVGVAIVLTGVDGRSYHYPTIVPKSRRYQADCGMTRTALISFNLTFRKWIPDADRVTQNKIMVRIGIDRFGDHG